MEPADASARQRGKVGGFAGRYKELGLFTPSPALRGCALPWRRPRGFAGGGHGVRTGEARTGLAACREHT